MILTEEEARKKWCQEARVAVAMKNNASTTEFFGVGGCNRGPLSEQVATMGASDPRNPDSARCIASECMAWRVGEKLRKVQDDAPGIEWTCTNPGAKSGNVEWHINTGYCGKAGKP